MESSDTRKEQLELHRGTPDTIVTIATGQNCEQELKIFDDDRQKRDNQSLQSRVQKFREHHRKHSYHLSPEGSTTAAGPSIFSGSSAAGSAHQILVRNAEAESTQRTAALGKRLITLEGSEVRSVVTSAAGPSSDCDIELGGFPWRADRVGSSDGGKAKDSEQESVEEREQRHGDLIQYMLVLHPHMGFPIADSLTKRALVHVKEYYAFDVLKNGCEVIEDIAAFFGVTPEQIIWDWYQSDWPHVLIAMESEHDAQNFKQKWHGQKTESKLKKHAAEPADKDFPEVPEKDFILNVEIVEEPSETALGEPLNTERSVLR